MQMNRILILLGSLLLVVGARLPWISVPVLYGVEGSAYEAIEIGWEDNGFVTGGAGLILLVAGVVFKRWVGMRYSIPSSLLAGLALLVVTGCFWSIVKLSPAAGFIAATDVGLYVTLVGSLLALVGAVGAVIPSLQSLLLSSAKSIRAV